MELTKAQAAFLAQLDNEANEALRLYGVESRAYSAALVRLGQYEDTLTQLPRTVEARYVAEHRPY